MNKFVFDFRRVESEDDLAFVMGTSGDRIRRFLANKALFITHHRLPKRGGRGFRDVIQIRDPEFADLYRTLAEQIHSFFAEHINGYPHDAVHGYVAGRSIRTNAAAHLKATKVLRADIKSFFPSITIGRLQGFLAGLGCTPAGSAVLADFLTVDETLPLGLSPSPVLANALCFELDVELSKKAAGGTYTRYADDLTFSGVEFPSKIWLKSILSKHGFALNEHKYRIEQRGRGLYVTGLSIEDGLMPRVPKAFKRRLRTEIHYSKALGLEVHAGNAEYSSIESAVNKITGRIQYLRGIERGVGDRLLKEWTAILEKEGVEPNFVTRHDRAPRDVKFFIDESESAPEVPPRLAVGCVVTEDPVSIQRSLQAFRNHLRLDPFMPGRKKPLETKGLHWTDLHEEAKEAFAKLLAILPVRVFVAFVRTKPSLERAEYEGLYLSLVRFLVRPRFSRYDRCRVVVAAEQNPNVSPNKFTAEITGIQAALSRTNSRRPITLETKVEGKLDEPCLSLADAFLGVFMDYATGPRGDQRAWPRARRFLRLRSKFRLIYDADTHDIFSRRNAFVRSSESGIGSEETSTQSGEARTVIETKGAARDPG